MEVHIGREIEKRFHESGMKLMEFARRLNTGKRNVYSIFERKEISVSQLKKIGNILQYDFFQLYTEAPSPPSTTPPSVKGSRASVTVLVELDGTQTTVDKWIAKLNAINTAVK